MNITKSPLELKQTVLQNIVKMLIDRAFLDIRSKNSILKAIISKANSDNITFRSDADHPYEIHVKFLTEYNVGKKQKRLF